MGRDLIMSEMPDLPRAPQGREVDAAVAMEGIESVAAVEERKPRCGGGDPNLAHYFRDMSNHPVLTHAEEVGATRRIQALEVAEWVEVLSYPPIAAHMLGLIRSVVGEAMPPEARRLQIRARLYMIGRSRLPKERWAALRTAAERVGLALRDLDCDRRLLDGCIRYVASAPAANGSCPPALRRLRHTARYERYLRDLAEAGRRSEAEKRRFTMANLRLVVSVARRYHRGRMSLADMIQEGNIGLMKAVDRYDVRKGYRFSTYASWWIRHSINRSLADKGRAIRIPVHMLDTHQRIQRAFASHAARWGCEPDDEMLGEEVGLDVDKVRSVRSQSIDAPFSLDRPVSDDEGRRFVDLLSDEGAANPFDELCRSDWCDEVERLLGRIPAIEASILRWRFGLGDEEELTLREIGDRYRLSRERIRQLQEQALGRMRHQMGMAFDG